MRGVFSFCAILAAAICSLQVAPVTSQSAVSKSNLVKSNATRSSTRDQIMKRIFNLNYKKYERPNENKQTRVMVYMKILAINSVDVSNMEYTTDVYLRQEWNDERLGWIIHKDFEHYNRSIVSPSLKEKIWLPDLFFRNGKKGYVHKMTSPNYLMRLSSNGTLLYSQKITMRFSCQMDLRTFPMDTQNCYMNIGSYGYTVDQLKFYWRPKDPLILGDNLKVSEFDSPRQSSIITYDCTTGSKTTTGAYTCLKAEFQLTRQLGSYLASTYIPNILIVMVSWLNFWVSIEAVPARITLGLLTLLGILTQATSVTQNLPRVSYIKAIDIWIIACIMFVIGALIEFAMASMMARRNKSESWKKDVHEIIRHELSRWCTACQQQQLSLLHVASHAGSGGKNGLMRIRPPALNRSQMEFCEELEMLLTADAAANSAAGGGADTHTLAKGERGGASGVGNGRRHHHHHSHQHHHHHQQQHQHYHTQNPSKSYHRRHTRNPNAAAAAGGGREGGSLLSSSRVANSGPLPTNTTSASATATSVSGSATSGGPTLTAACRPPNSTESEIDAYSRFLFPACFILYNCFYWLYYLVLVRKK